MSSRLQDPAKANLIFMKFYGDSIFTCSSSLVGKGKGFGVSTSSNSDLESDLIYLSIIGSLIQSTTNDQKMFQPRISVKDLIL